MDRGIADRVTKVVLSANSSGNGDRISDQRRSGAARPGAGAESVRAAANTHAATAPAECLLRIAIPFFPGRAAAVDGRAADVVDYALSGVFVPAGEHEVTLQYRSRWFRLGAMASLVTAAACLEIILRPLFTSRRGTT